MQLGITSLDVMLLREAEYAELIMEGVPQPSPFSYDIGYGNDIACICKHVLFISMFCCFFCGPNVDVSLFPANDGCGVSWCPVEAI